MVGCCAEMSYEDDETVVTMKKCEEDTDQVCGQAWRRVCGSFNVKHRLTLVQHTNCRQYADVYASGFSLTEPYSISWGFQNAS